jgi:endoglucanase
MTNRMKKNDLWFCAVIITAILLTLSCSTETTNSVITYPDVPGTPEEPMPFNDITATELVANIKVGWNLGNTLDAIGNTAIGFSWLGGGFYSATSVSQMETAWGNPITTKENITTIKNAGFNTIRIPVSWSKAVDSEFNIRMDWMTRVVEVVNYAVENDLYIILNTHHDEEIFKFTNSEVEKSLEAFRKIWGQIAWAFKNYDEKLVFEALNEPRTKGSPHEWSGGNHEEHNNINRYYKVFIEVVRASGGNNNKRILMLNTHAASAAQVAMNGLVIPEDTVPNKIIASIHAYTPYNFALNTNHAFNTWDIDNPSDTNPIIDIFERAYNTFIVGKNVPVVMGEFGAMNKDNESIRAQWVEFYVRTAMERGIPCIWWDNGGFTGDGELFGLLNRRNNTIAFPEVLDGIMQGASVWGN